MLNQYEGKEHIFGGLQGLASLEGIRATMGILKYLYMWLNECIGVYYTLTLYSRKVYYGGL